MAYNMPNTALATIKAKVAAGDTVGGPAATAAALAAKENALQAAQAQLAAIGQTHAAELAAKDAQIAELAAANTTLRGEKVELAEQVETLTARVAELEAEAEGDGGEGGGDEPGPEADE